MKKINIYNPSDDKRQTFRIGIEFFALPTNIPWISKTVNKIEKYIIYSILSLITVLSLMIMLVFIFSFITTINNTNFFSIFYYITIGLFVVTCISYVILDWFFFGKFFLNNRIKEGWLPLYEEDRQYLIQLKLIDDNGVSLKSNQKELTEKDSNNIKSEEDKIISNQ